MTILALATLFYQYRIRCRKCRRAKQERNCQEALVEPLVQPQLFPVVLSEESSLIGWLKNMVEANE